MKEALDRARKLFHGGALALAAVESNGIRVDRAYLKKAVADTEALIADKEKALKADKVWRLWRKEFDKPVLGNADQLGRLFFGVMGHKAPGLTAKGRLKADEKSFAAVDHPFPKEYFAWKHLIKVRSTYLLGVLNEQQDGVLHPFFNLDTVRTYRGCLARGALIETVRDVSKYPDGIPIENVRAGDYVYCYNANLKLTLRRVLWAGKTGHKKIVRVHWSAKDKTGFVDMTPEHKVRLVDGRYVEAQKLMTEGVGTKWYARVHALAMGRGGDRIWETGCVIPKLDHRFIYQRLVGKLGKGEVIHHRDENHLNNKPSNLEKMSPSEHSRVHAPTSLTAAGRKKAAAVRRRRIKAGEITFKAGEDSPIWIHMTRFQLLRLLARSGGKVSRTVHAFECLKRKAALLGVDLKAVKVRYDADGKYIGIGRLLRALELPRKHDAVKSLKVNFYKMEKLCRQRGLPLYGNHRIVAVEWLGRSADVYDLEVEGCHNFIAGELCVHNSSSLPNFQNFPIRNPEMARLIRTAFIPRKGRLLVEFDFSGAEVRSAACYNKDPELIRYIQDPRSDMHRDQAVELFMLPPDLVDKKTTRDVSKNSFVFAEFYGSYYVDCARNIWEVMVSRGFKLPDGTSVKDHLAKKGIKKLGACDPSRKPVPGTFEHHVKGVEDRLWNQRFPAYRDWKKRWYSAYLKKGHFDSLTGFRMRGIFSRNDCINYPVQGTAFHWLLWTLVRLQRWLEKHNFRCKIVGQIHDSIILDCPPEELQAVLEEAHRLVTVGLGKYWDWICVPLDVEADVSDTNWHEKKQWVRGGSGVWGIGK